MAPFVVEPAEPCSMALLLDSFESSEQPMSGGDIQAAVMMRAERGPTTREMECFTTPY